MSEDHSPDSERRDDVDRPPPAAPYEREPDSPRSDVDQARPWREAGRSVAAHAERLTTYYRTSGTPLERTRARLGRGLDDVDELRRKATACRRVGRTLDRMTASGWAVWHDRRLAGTEEILDHVLVGPDGITCVLSVHPSGTFPGAPIAATTVAARQRLQRLLPTVVARFEEALPTWTGEIWVVVAVDGTTVPILELPQVVSRHAIRASIEAHTRSWSPMQVADVALALEDAFPYASLGAAR